jgi:hypothetical protein
VKVDLKIIVNSIGENLKKLLSSNPRIGQVVVLNELNNIVESCTGLVYAAISNEAERLYPSNEEARLNYIGQRMVGVPSTLVPLLVSFLNMLETYNEEIVKDKEITPKEIVDALRKAI